jgi:hypothetical protein
MTKVILEAFVSKSINPFYLYFKILDEMKGNLPSKYTKIYPKRVHFLA